MNEYEKESLKTDKIMSNTLNGGMAGMALSGFAGIIALATGGAAIPVMIAVAAGGHVLGYAKGKHEANQIK